METAPLHELRPDREIGGRDGHGRERWPAFSRLARTVRFDGLWWRKLARLGCVYGPEWWKRIGPPIVALIIFCAVGRNRRGATANQARVLGVDERSVRALWAGFAVFRTFARCMTETLEFYGPRPRRFAIDEPERNYLAEALTRGRGVILVTAHVGNWDISARALNAMGQPVNLVMAREPNETTQDYSRRSREIAGVKVILSDSSVFSAFNMIRALRRNEILAIQFDRGVWGPAAPNEIERVPFFGESARFLKGPFHLARLSGAPIVPVFTLRRGLRHYEIRLGRPRFVEKAATADVDQALRETVAVLEDTVRNHPDQWFEFAPFWSEDPR